MPRIIFVILFLIFTLAPFVLIKMAEAILGVDAPVGQTTSQTANQAGSTTYSSHRHNYGPYYGGFFYYGNRGRGGWLGRTYRSSSSSFGGSSRSYSGGSSSFKGGSFGSFGK